ncbi:MAG: dihydroorotase [Bacteroidales bacterium]|nr:dihydroorotase [Bacteroidales bacterium]
MSKKYRIVNARIVNEGKIFKGDIIINNGIIEDIINIDNFREYKNDDDSIIIDVNGKYLFPGVIDTHVHFREPGLTHKADIFTESKAAVAGGVTSFMEMPNTIPNTTTLELLEDKFKLASEKSLANYSFYFGASNDNIQEIDKIDFENTCGIKVFMGASTGNMLVDNITSLNKIFSNTNIIISVHSEDNKIINDNLEKYKAKYGDNIPFKYHPLIRSREACIKSTEFAVNTALKYNTHLNILHISTKEELEILKSVKESNITSEACLNYLFFNDNDYDKYGALIKCNPAIKSREDQQALKNAVFDDDIDLISTDHAPHLFNEKNKSYLNSPSGTPNVQHLLPAILEFYHNNKISLVKIIDKLCHRPAKIFNIKNRGFIRKGYFADIVIVDLNCPWKVNNSNILYKCKWSPFNDFTFNSKVIFTFVNGNLIYNNGNINDKNKGQRLIFER